MAFSHSPIKYLHLNVSSFTGTSHASPSHLPPPENWALPMTPVWLWHCHFTISHCPVSLTQQLPLLHVWRLLHDVLRLPAPLKYAMWWFCLLSLNPEQSLLHKCDSCHTPCKSSPLHAMWWRFQVVCSQQGTPSAHFYTSHNVILTSLCFFIFNSSHSLNMPHLCAMISPVFLKNTTNFPTSHNAWKSFCLSLLWGSQRTECLETGCGCRIRIWTPALA